MDLNKMTIEELKKLNHDIEKTLAEKEKEHKRESRIKFLEDEISDYEKRIKNITKYRGESDDYPNLFYELERAVHKEYTPFRYMEEYNTEDFMSELYFAWIHYPDKLMKEQTELKNELNNLTQEEPQAT